VCGVGWQVGVGVCEAMRGCGEYGCKAIRDVEGVVVLGVAWLAFGFDCWVAMVWMLRSWLSGGGNALGFVFLGVGGGWVGFLGLVLVEGEGGRVWGWQVVGGVRWGG